MADRFVLFLIRHLPTHGNRERKYIGWTDEPILETTIEQRCLIATSTVFGSDLIRTRQSAAVYFPNAKFVTDSRWRECNFGIFEGKTYADLEKDEDYRRWIEDPERNPPPEGESLAQVKTRVLSVVKEMPNGAVIMTHGGPIRVLLTAFSQEQKPFWSWDVPHGAAYRLEWDNATAFKEERACTSISAVPITARGLT